jgi:hypothetical protein
MTNYSENVASPQSRSSKEQLILTVADSCFEMYPTKELRRPGMILSELQTAFPDLEQPDILRAISLALTWRRLLHAAGRPLH